MVALGLVSGGRAGCAQDMEPRAFSASPIGTNFLVGSYARTTGAISLDPALPIANVRASINTGLLGYSRTFGLFGQQASAAIAIPYFAGQVSGQVVDASGQVTRRGAGDIRLRFAENLIGSPALMPAQFAQRQPTTTLGVSLTVTAPTGDYNHQHLVNVSTHRWAFRPEIGVSQPLGDWFVDGAAGVSLFTDNTDFLGHHDRGEQPLWSLQAHGGYYFRPGLWLALDMTHYFGADTILDGVNKRDFQTVTRYGATLSLPLGQGFSAKLSGSSWLTAHNGGGFDSLIFTLQYRWFDR